ncbi:TATA-box binding protein [Plasmodium gonderi]|uniref:TATA-box binding protein n=1 Tax=Plasmodium gonderi TaxID=77519 RepID=A0A1Y1JM79_PLAGO|nr:TATA-box binding protein [Plasmodium gonderi]GAW81493.1 TATA-box binding protein [Plasmodium gonderi]
MNINISCDLGDPSTLLRDDEVSEKSMKEFLDENDIFEGHCQGNDILERYNLGCEKGANLEIDEVASEKQSKNKLVHKNITLNIHNIIASANVCTEVDLRLIAISIRNAEYNPSKINTLIVRLNKPKCTALIFKNGRIMLTGTKTKGEAIHGCKKIGKIIKIVTNEYVKLEGFKIENIIASADCNMPIRLEMLAHDHKEYCNYEPELFAGLVYRYKPTSKLKSVILIFVSGKIIITGCKSVQKLYTVFQDIYNVLYQYRS